MEHKGCVMRGNLSSQLGSTIHNSYAHNVFVIPVVRLRGAFGAAGRLGKLDGWLPGDFGRFDASAALRRLDENAIG